MLPSLKVMKQRIRESSIHVAYNDKFEATVSPLERCEFVGVKFEARHETGVAKLTQNFTVEKSFKISNYVVIIG